MPQRSFIHDSVSGDRVNDAVDLRRAFRGVATDGVVAGHLNEAKVTSTSPETDDVRVLTGRVWVNGSYMDVYTSDVTLDLAVADGSNPRWDRVVARLDPSTRETRLAVLQGTPAASPTKPALTQTAGSTWEVLLADVYIPANSTQIFASESVATAGEGWVEDRRTWATTPTTSVVQQVIFTADGTFTKADYPGLVAVKVRVLGAGGGGGGAGTPSAGYGGGGGSGGYAESIIPHGTLGLSETVTVGSGGAGGAGAATGASGGGASFGTHVACNGAAGGGTNTGAGVAVSGSRGVATAGGLQINGASGQRGDSDGTIVSGGRGGASTLHGGGNALKLPVAAGSSLQGAGGVAGSGGGGAINGGGGAAAGGDGGDGLVIVEIIG